MNRASIQNTTPKYVDERHVHVRVDGRGVLWLILAIAIFILVSWR